MARSAPLTGPQTGGALRIGGSRPNVFRSIRMVSTYDFGMSRKRGAGVQRVRVLNDGIIDEDGLRWDRVRENEGYYLTEKESRLFINRAVRFLRTDGFGSAARDVDGKVEFNRLARDSLGYRVHAFKASDGSKRIIVSVDTSDC